ncbi:hypothetical protein M5689_001668 [Euphorbia peplus]|nr:hypothetical protein M5689_001668 [Euphorbia peplus]
MIIDYDEDFPSLSDLPLHDIRQEIDFISSSHITANQDFFEFSTSTNSSISSSENNDHLIADDIIFCGKIIPTSKRNILEHEKFMPTSKRNILEPEKFYYTPQVIRHAKITMERKEESASKSVIRGRMPDSPRKHRILFGLPAKIPTKMKLSDIKERQSRLAPKTQMFPTDETNGDSKRGNRMGLIRKPRLHIWGLAKASFSCFPIPNKPSVHH